MVTTNKCIFCDEEYGDSEQHQCFVIDGFESSKIIEYQPTNTITFYAGDNEFLFEVGAKDGEIVVTYSDKLEAHILADKTAKTFWKLWPEFLTEIIKGNMNNE